MFHELVSIFAYLFVIIDWVNRITWLPALIDGIIGKIHPFYVNFFASIKGRTSNERVYFDRSG